MDDANLCKLLLGEKHCIIYNYFPTRNGNKDLMIYYFYEWFIALSTSLSVSNLKLFKNKESLGCDISN